MLKGSCILFAFTKTMEPARRCGWRRSLHLRLWISLLLALSALCHIAAAHAAHGPPLLIEDLPSQVLSDEMATHINHGKPLTLEQAIELDALQDFMPPRRGSASATNFGLTQAEVWLRLRFNTADDPLGLRLLEIGHASLDRVDLYLAADGEAWRHQHSGDLIAFADRPVAHRNHVFNLQLQPDTYYTLYLRVASQGTLSVPVTLWRPSALWHADQISYALLSLYYGLLIGLLVYNLFLYLALKERLYLIYVAFVGLLAIGQAGLAGLSAQFLWPDDPWLAHLSPTAGVAAAGAFGALFVQGFLGGTPRRMHLHWLMPAVSVAYTATFLCAVFWSYFHAAVAVNLISLVFASGALTLGAGALMRRQPGARFFVLAWVSLLLGILIIALHNLGVLPSNAFTANALLIGSALEMLLLSLALADRINAIQRLHELAQAEALQVRQQMVEALRESERRLESRVQERTLLLEQANQQLRESQHLLEQQANHDALTGLANRKLLADRLDGALARARRNNTRFALIMADLDRFKAVNDSLGHAAGDEVLRQVSTRLRGAVRASDTVARVGGDEFVLLLEDISMSDSVALVLDKLVDAVTAPMQVEAEAAVMIGVSVGHAIYPDDGEQLDLLLGHADKAMYKGKPAYAKA